MMAQCKAAPVLTGLRQVSRRAKVGRSSSARKAGEVELGVAYHQSADHLSKFFNEEVGYCAHLLCCSHFSVSGFENVRVQVQLSLEVVVYRFGAADHFYRAVPVKEKFLGA